MAKGIRVNQLAKELGVESKAILKRLADEGIPNVPNHMSLLQIGLAETVREWVRDGLIPTTSSVAVETIEAKPKASRGKKKAAHVEEAAPTDSEQVMTEEAPLAGEGQGQEGEYAPEGGDGQNGEVYATNGTEEVGADGAYATADGTYVDGGYEGQPEQGDGSGQEQLAEADGSVTADAGGQGGETAEHAAEGTHSATYEGIDLGEPTSTHSAPTDAGAGPRVTAGEGSAVGAPVGADADGAKPAADATVRPGTPAAGTSRTGGVAPAVRAPVRPPVPSSKPVSAVPFQAKPATLQGPRVVADKSQIQIERPVFGRKVSQPQGPGKAVPPPAAKHATAAPGVPVAKGPAGPGVKPGAPGAAPGGPAVARGPAGAGPTAPAAPAGPGAGAGPGGPAAGPMGPGGVRPPVQMGPGGRPYNRLAADGTVLRQEQRPTISLNNPTSLPSRPVAVPSDKKPIQMVVPAPAQVRGPTVVRVEQPDHVPAPRGPRGPGRPDQTTALPTARPGVGRGVRSTTGTEDEETEAKKAAAKNRGSLSARRRGLDGRRGEAEERLKEFTEADKIARQDMLNAAAATRAGMESHLRKTGARGTHQISKTALQRGGVLEIEEPITVKSLSAAIGVKSSDIIKRFMLKRIPVTINQALSIDQATEIAMDYGLDLQVAQEVSPEERLMIEYDEALAESTDLVQRPAVVTILGHVDHGKTSLLDKIRSANVAAGEAGGITQHIAAWTVTVGAEGAKKRVTFIDTPGHQAFTSMRARGANMTDVVVLVVSAAEGVQPQTIESINHAKAAEVPIVVAMNKIDRADANPDMVLGQLAANGLNPVEWGGDTEVIRVSAMTGQGIPELIEILDYQSALLELKADPSLPGRGTVIEARRDDGLGPVATVLVQQGTLSVGDYVLCGPGYGRVRSLIDDMGRPIAEAGPSTPVIVSGLSDLPSSGDVLLGVADLEEARAIAEDRAVRSRQKNLAALHQRTTSGNIVATIKAGQVQTINLIIKADTQGSIETLVKTVTDSNTEEVKVRVIHSGVGAITESDVELAMATKAKPTDNRVAIIGFHVTPDEVARAMGEHNHIDVKTYRVIYEIFDDLKKALSGMLAPEEREKYHGRAEIRQIFKVSRVGNIAGCMVIDGHIQRGSKIRLIRNGNVIVENLVIETLKRVKDDAKEVKQGFECGIKIAGYDDIKITDVLEAYIKETFERTL